LDTINKITKNQNKESLASGEDTVRSAKIK